MIEAVLLNYDKIVRKFRIEVCPYGLFVLTDDVRDHEMEDFLIGRCREYLRSGIVDREELRGYGGERPEGYVYAYGMLHQFQRPCDGYWVSFPHEDLFTLYPGDNTYDRIDFLQKERASICNVIKLGSVHTYRGYISRCR